ncbi:CAAX protease self-immunity [Geodermatophilus ruber]|uniref:CAAX protease self-immunity n=1 Tax=Geodermatophilus ruber TaxID=504800 RepID=A0A1I4FAR7_9ACTN|nr:CAAX protease self-immunity [Geodermatophilus ruber]
MFAASLALVLAGWNNLVIPALPGTTTVYVGVNLAATALLLAAARAVGLSWAELGLDRRRWAAGARWGGAAAGVVATGYAVALAVPSLRPLLEDERLAGLPGGALAVQVLVRIPLGTVVWEEVAFRGVLLAALARVLPLPAAAGLAAAVFGVWHVRPTLGALAANDLAGDGAARVLAVLLACLGTAAAGLVFTWLRLRSGSLLAPVLLHLATNCLGALAAAAARRAG